MDPDLDGIDKDKRTDFPAGVSEVEYATEAEVRAFVDGFDFADNIDCESGEPFERDGKWVVRVCVGDWGDEDEDLFD